MGANSLCHGNEISDLIKDKFKAAEAVKENAFDERLRVFAADNAARGAREFGNALIDSFRKIAFNHGGDTTLTALQIIGLLKHARAGIGKPVKEESGHFTISGKLVEP